MKTTMNNAMTRDAAIETLEGIHSALYDNGQIPRTGTDWYTVEERIEENASKYEGYADAVDIVGDDEAMDILKGWY